MESFEYLLKYVENEMDFATSHYDDAYLKRRLAARMRRVDTDDYTAYYSLLKSDEAERAALLDTLSVNVTSFFRNPLVWERIRDVLRTLTDEKSVVRVWSAACSDGREPYSIAMLALDDPEINAAALSIHATDIDGEILQVAREGVYHSTRTTDIDDQLTPLDDYSTFIHREDEQFTVDSRVKQMVTFEKHDLINGDPKTNFDVVVCRNMFIYIDVQYKLAILETVTESLQSGGYLAIGKTETLPDELKSVFKPIDKRLRVYQLRE